MMFTEFMHYYNYTADQTLTEYAKRFFGLVNSMYRVQGKKALEHISIVSAGTNGGQDGSKIVDEFKKQYKGQHGILQEVRNLKG